MDETKRRHKEIENVILGYLTENGFQTIVLDSAIIPEEENSEAIQSSIVRTFDRAGDLLDKWRDKTAEMYPDKPELLQYIPTRDGLKLSKLNNIDLMTDTCNTARKVARLLAKSIKEACREENMTDEQIAVYTGHCWHHLRCLWIGAGLKHADKYLSDLLGDNLHDIPLLLRVTTNIENILISLEKEFALTANYAKGHGSLFCAWMLKFHKGALLFPILRVTAGTCQDSGTEGTIVAYMIRTFYLKFLAKKLSSKSSKHDIL